jgi:hypothetical protein
VREMRRGEPVRGLWGAEFFEGPRGGFYWGRGGGERLGEAEKRLAMVGSFNGFGRFGIEGGSGEDGVGHHFEKRRASGAVDSAYLGTEESAGGIGAAATPTKGGSGCNQWWGATSSKGGRSLGGRVGHLGWTELAGRLGPAGKLRLGKWGDKAAQDEGRRVEPGQGGGLEGGEEGAGRPGGERGQAPARLGRGGLGR